MALASLARAWRRGDDGRRREKTTAKNGENARKQNRLGELLRAYLFITKGVKHWYFWQRHGMLSPCVLSSTFILRYICSPLLWRGDVSCLFSQKKKRLACKTCAWLEHGSSLSPATRPICALLPIMLCCLQAPPPSPTPFCPLPPPSSFSLLHLL